MKDYIRRTNIFSIYKKVKIIYEKLSYRIIYSRLNLLISYKISFILNILKNIFYYRNKKKTSSKIEWNNIKSVLLVHSKMHFSPTEDNPKRPYYYSGIGSTARHIWKLCEGKSRFFIDIKARKIDQIPKVDVVIGLMSKNFRRCAKANPQAKKILLLVNCHPLYRAKMLLDEAKSLNKPIPKAEWIKPKLFSQCRNSVDSIALSGNSFTKSTFIEYGVKEIPIFPFDIGINTHVLFPLEKLRPTDRVRFIYPASHKGLRKGLFRVLETWEHLNTIVPPAKIELFLLGGDEPVFTKEVDGIISRFSNIHNLGWVDDALQISYLQSSHSVLAPAIEEGQVSAVLEAMACGAVPIITKQCGINLTDTVDGFIVKDYKDSSEMASYMKNLIDNKGIREKMSRKAMEHVLRYHNWESFQKNFKEIIRD